MADQNLFVSSPMTSSSILDEFFKIIPIVVGGFLALSGVAIGQVMTHRLAKARERESMLRQKAEMLVKALFAHLQWLEEKRTTSVFSDEEHDTPDPLNEARMLQRLYFPELAMEIAAVSAAYVPTLTYLHDQKIKKMTDKATWMNSYRSEDYVKLYKKCHDAVEATTDKLVRVIDEHTKT